MLWTTGLVNSLIPKPQHEAKLKCEALPSKLVQDYRSKNASTAKGCSPTQDSRTHAPRVLGDHPYSPFRLPPLFSEFV